MSERALGRYVRWLYNRFDVVFAPSRLMCAYLNSLGVQHTAHQPLGVDAEIFSPQRRTMDLRAKLGLPRGTRLLVYAGRFAGEKNVPVLLQAFAKLGRPYHLLLIGGGCEARPTHNITLLPYRRDCIELAQWLASADALVHAGTNETFGLVVLEAMACGRPVVGARAGAIPEIVDERSRDCSRTLASAESMAEAIAALYERDIDARSAPRRARACCRNSPGTHAFQSQIKPYLSLVGAAQSASAQWPIPARLLSARPEKNPACDPARGDAQSDAPECALVPRSDSRRHRCIE